MQGWALDGFMQEYCIVDHKTAFVLPDDLDAKKAAPLTCAGITAFNAVRRPGLKEGQWLGVVGCGGLGQLGRLVQNFDCLMTNSPQPEH
jgi:alcohol dehydrogenase, propanol-preferring